MPATVNPYMSFGATAAGGGAVGEPWGEVARQTSVSGGKLTISGLDLSGVMMVRLLISGVTVTTDDSSVALRFLISGSEVSSGYLWGQKNMSSGINVDIGSASDSGIMLTSTTATNMVGNASTESFGGVVTVGSPSGSLHKRCYYRTVWQRPNANVIGSMSAGGKLNDTGPITGFALVGSSNLTAGTMILLGVS